MSVDVKITQGDRKPLLLDYRLTALNNIVNESADHKYYGTIQAMAEELGEIAKADKLLKLCDINDGDWHYDDVIEELGDLVYNIEIYAQRLGFSIEDIIETNLDKIKLAQNNSIEFQSNKI